MKEIRKVVQTLSREEKSVVGGGGGSGGGGGLRTGTKHKVTPGIPEWQITDPFPNFNGCTVKLGSIVSGDSLVSSWAPRNTF